jgi:hypothetical protein
MPSNALRAVLQLTGCFLLASLALFLARAPLTWAAATLAAAAGLIALCIEPAVGLIAVALLIPVGGLMRLPLPGVNVVDLLAALTVAAWLAQGVARRRILFRPPPLTWPLLAFVWIAGLSLTQADSWREGLPEWLKWAEFAGLYLVAAQILDRKRLAWVLAGLFAAGLAETALGVYQFVRQVGPEAFVLDGRFMRAYGTFQQPNPYAGYLGCLAPVAASLALGGLGQWWGSRGHPSTSQRKTRCSAQDASAQDASAQLFMPGAAPRPLRVKAAEAAPMPPERRAWEPDPLFSGQDASAQDASAQLFMPGVAPRPLRVKAAEAAPMPPERRAWEPDPLFSGQDAFAQPESSLQAVWRASASNQLKPRLQPFSVQLWLGLICGLAAVALAAGIGLSWSRGGWLGLAAGLVAVVALRSRRTAIVTVTTLVALLLAVTVLGTAWLPGAIGARLADLGNYLVGPDPAQTEISDANFAVLERLAHWEAGLRMFADRPWLGVGIGNYGVAYARYALPHWYDALGHAHNVYVNFLAETGILGAAAFAIFWLGLAWHALRWKTVLVPVSSGLEASAGSPHRLLDRLEPGILDERSRFRKALAIGVLGALVYLSIHSIFDNLFVQHVQLQLALLMGGLAAMEQVAV